MGKTRFTNIPMEISQKVAPNLRGFFTGIRIALHRRARAKKLPRVVARERARRGIEAVSMAVKNLLTSITKRKRTAKTEPPTATETAILRISPHLTFMIRTLNLFLTIQRWNEGLRLVLFDISSATKRTLRS